MQFFFNSIFKPIFVLVEFTKYCVYAQKSDPQSQLLTVGLYVYLFHEVKKFSLRYLTFKQFTDVQRGCYQAENI